MSDPNNKNQEITMANAFQSIGSQLQQMTQMSQSFYNTIGFTIKQSGVLEMQRQIHEMLRHPGFRAAQESLSQLVAQTAIAASSISQLQHQVGAAVQGIVGQLDAYAFSAAAVQRQIISMVDGIDWEALIEATEEEERAQLAEETNKIRELLTRDYLNLNALVLQVKDFIASLNIKNPAIYLLVTVFILQPISDDISDAIREGARTIITQAYHNTFNHKDVRPKTIRNEAAAALSGVEPLFVDAIRVVLKSELELRMQATRQSKVIVTLALGQKVRFIVTKGDWTKIESYDAATNTHHSGWVYTRYLDKVEK